VKIRSAEFWAAAASASAVPEAQYPEVAIAGRSNVGKSTLINAMTARRSLARTSSTPGCTRGLVFFRINDRVCLVDLPGYGYARRSKGERGRWKKLVEGYLLGREELGGVLILVDVRRGPENQEVELADFLYTHDIAFVWVLTKCDKLKRAQLDRRRRELAELFGEAPCVLTSGREGKGIDGLWKWVEAATS